TSPSASGTARPRSATPPRGCVSCGCWRRPRGVFAPRAVGSSSPTEPPAFETKPLPPAPSPRRRGGKDLLLPLSAWGRGWGGGVLSHNPPAMATHEQQPETQARDPASPDPGSFLRIAPDVRLGRNVMVHCFVNLYGCAIGDDSRVGAFVEIQKNATIG